MEKDPEQAGVLKDRYSIKLAIQRTRVLIRVPPADQRLDLHHDGGNLELCRSMAASKGIRKPKEAYSLVPEVREMPGTGHLRPRALGLIENRELCKFLDLRQS